MRGAHRGVWCSKAQHLIEAELFAAERKRPAPDGRALSCAAPYARKIQGLTASQNLPDARNRAPVSLVSPRDRRESRCKGRFEGVKRGQGNHTVPLPPFAPAAGRRQSPSPWARRTPAAGRRQCTAMSWRISPGSGGSVSPAAASRRNGGTAHPLLRVKTTAHRWIGGRSASC